ncbi:alpha/beta fold hydrolase [Shewanella sp. AS16]|uniref:alpha/beta fold hydrolase n=1 Tax=Shewanella sp. AS16 TaxID=2907625 RepID=UPI001F3E9649|nr:alpha/beta fold hydrolase [Shewanella sp. AS16]MCE9685185.1 alpha/beta fold hydrolase [Shewanella sp. AS16]
MANCLLEGEPGDTLVILAHGAGANMHSDFMAAMAAGLAAKGLRVLRFNFPYMQANALDGKRRPPDRASKLLAHFAQVLTAAKCLGAKKIVLMGKSMGGRMAAIMGTDAAMAAEIAGVVCLGYPFVPLKGGEPRLAPLNDCRVPVMIVQGERDKFGCVSQVPHWPLAAAIRIEWLGDGDHSFVPRKSSGNTEAANLAAALDFCSDFIGGLDA